MEILSEKVSRFSKSFIFVLVVFRAEKKRKIESYLSKTET